MRLVSGGQYGSSGGGPVTVGLRLMCMAGAASNLSLRMATAFNAHPAFRADTDQPFKEPQHCFVK